MPGVLDKNGPILIVEDDEDDREFIGKALNALNLKNQIMYFKDGQEALNILAQNLLFLS